LLDLYRTSRLFQFSYLPVITTPLASSHQANYVQSYNTRIPVNHQSAHLPFFYINTSSASAVPPLSQPEFVIYALLQ